jgi:hypothetical protein
MSGVVTVFIYILCYKFLPVVMYGRETCSLILREEHRLRVFENRVLRRVFGPKSNEVREIGENCILSSFITCTFRQV